MEAAQVPTNLRACQPKDGQDRRRPLPFDGNQPTVGLALPHAELLVSLRLM